MPNTVVLITDGPLRVEDLLERYRSAGDPYLSEDGRLVVETAEGYFAIANDDRLREEYKADELALIEQLIAAPKFSSIEYRMQTDLQTALREVAEIPHALVDDDHGAIVPLAGFHARLQAGTSN